MKRTVVFLLSVIILSAPVRVLAAQSRTIFHSEDCEEKHCEKGFEAAEVLSTHIIHLLMGVFVVCDFIIGECKTKKVAFTATFKLYIFQYMRLKIFG